MRRPVEIKLDVKDLMDFTWACRDCTAGQIFNWGAPAVGEHIFFHLREFPGHVIEVKAKRS